MDQNWQGFWIHLDGIDHRGTLMGWAFDAERPLQRVHLKGFVDSEEFDTFSANQFRGDLLARGVGDGFHAFSVLIPRKYMDGRSHSLHCCAISPISRPTRGRPSISVEFPKAFTVDSPWRGLPGSPNNSYRQYVALKSQIIADLDPLPVLELSDFLDNHPSFVFNDFGFLERAYRRGEQFPTLYDMLCARLRSPATSTLVHVFNRKRFTKSYCAKHGIRTAELLLSASNVEELTSFEFPSRFVIKPDDDSGVCSFIYVDGMDLLSRRPTTVPQIIHAVEEYRRSKPDAVFLVEEVLQQTGGDAATIPIDYKFHTFGGRVRVIHVNDKNVFSARMPCFRQVGWLSPDWAPAPHRMRVAEEEAVDFLRPSNLDEMIEMAERIQAHCGDYVRVDLYNTVDGIALGEVTIFSHAGEGFTPFGDYVLAQAWHISRLDERQDRRADLDSSFRAG